MRAALILISAIAVSSCGSHFKMAQPDPAPWPTTPEGQAAARRVEADAVSLCGPTSVERATRPNGDLRGDGSRPGDYQCARPKK